MRVSVIIPIFNCERYLKQSIGALLRQTYKDFELILVDDGSTDDGLSICKKYADVDKRVIIRHKEKSEGAGPARNTGIDIARGEYLMFIDADDRLEQDMIERLVRAMDEKKADVCVCGYDTYVEGVNDNSREVFSLDEQLLDTPEKAKHFFAKLFPEGMAGYLWNKIYRADIIKEHGIRFPDMRRLQDGVFNVIYFDHVSSCYILSEQLYHYRVNAQTDMFKKCPTNYYDLIRRFSLDFIDTKKGWNENDNEKIYTFFLNETGNCIENAYSKQWKLDRGKRKKYFDNIAQDEFFRQVMADMPALGRYRSKLVTMLAGKKYGGISVLVRIKIFTKTSFKKVFYFTKGLAGR